jgi:hypothetical protein
MKLENEMEKAFVRDAKRRGKTKEETMVKLANLRASGAFRDDGDKPGEKRSVEEKPEPMNTRTALLTGLQKAVDGATFGYGDEIFSGIETLKGKLPGGSGKSYKENMAENNADEDQFAEEHPGWNIGAELVGGLATGGIGAARIAAAKGLGAVGKMATGAASGAGGTTNYLFGEGDGAQEGDSFSESMYKRLENVTDNPGAIGLGAVIPAGLTAAGKPFRAIGDRARAGANRPEVQRLREKGVQPTVGQTVGGKIGQLEDKAVDYELSGARAARQRVEDQWRKSFFDDALKPLGVKVDDADPRIMMQQARKAVDDAYDEARALLPESVSIDGLNGALTKARSISGKKVSLNKKQSDSISKFLENEVSSRMVDGKLTKEAISEIEEIIRNQASDQAAKGNKNVATAYEDLLEGFSGWLGNSAKGYEAAIKRANQGYMGLSRLRDSAKGADLSDFNPGQANRATKKQDASADQGTTGEGYLQQEAQDAVSVLGNKVDKPGSRNAKDGEPGMLGSVLGAIPSLAARPMSGPNAQKNIVDMLMGDNRVAKGARAAGDWGLPGLFGNAVGRYQGDERK